MFTKTFLSIQIDRKIDLKNIDLQENDILNMYIIILIILSIRLISFLGLILFLGHFVASRHISKPCPTKSSNVDSTINAANITREEIAQNLWIRLNLFHNATQKLIEKYVSNFSFFNFQLAMLYVVCCFFVINYKREKHIYMILRM